MKTLLTIIAAALIPMVGFAQVPKNVTQNPTTKQITDNLTFGSGRTLQTSSGSTVTINGEFNANPTTGTVNLDDVDLTVGNTSTAEGASIVIKGYEVNDVTDELFFTPHFGKTYQNLYFSNSTSGKGWQSMSGTNYYKPASGDFRDPSIMYYDGYWWIAYTAGTFGNVNYFTIIKSADLITWSTVGNVSTASVGTIQYTWSPEWYVESGTIYCTVTIKTTTGTFGLYRVTAQNAGLTSWSNPTAITGTGFPTNVIDSFLIKDGSTYYLFYKDEDNRYIQIASSSSMISGYTQLQTGNFAGWGDGMEGITVLTLADGTYRIYFEDYQGIDAQYFYSESAGPPFATWTTKVACKTQDWGHGTVLRLTDIDQIHTVRKAQRLDPTLLDWTRITGANWKAGTRASIFFGNTQDTYGIGMTYNEGFFVSTYDVTDAFVVRHSTGNVEINKGLIQFEGATADANETTLSVEDPSGDRAYRLANAPTTSTLNVTAALTKTDTGDPASGYEGQIVINTFDNTLKVYADGGWRQIATW